ncbi:uncharacterized protein CEXT_811831 [Caerostris extrusa]|uniref:Kinesin motor domain-containing protein n=1 Tax=Caerostris extrusa TaxID=172846 RepID=A0AAV4NK98_CAEEX|nr:uncharacterized protein CEXT_811831 [Caerostris extrusa]
MSVFCKVIQAIASQFPRRPKCASMHIYFVVLLKNKVIQFSMKTVQKSHLIFRMVFEIGDHTDGTIHISELNLVDFAGLRASEQEMNEFPKCKNDSLFFLSEIILQLRHKQAKDVNYERSKLTRVLKNSFGGKAVTLLICTVIPTNLIETFYALQFGIATMHVKNESKVVASAEKSLVCKLRDLHYFNLEPIESAAKLQQAQGMDEKLKKIISYCNYILIPVLKMKTYNLKSLCGSSSSTLRCRKSLASHSQPFIIKTKQNVKYCYIPEDKKKV